MADGYEITPFHSEWCFRANYGIPWKRWQYWRRKGLTVKQINKKFPGDPG